MTQTLSRPIDFDLEHEEWRANQFETVEWALNQKNPMLIEAPTGFGKTGLAKAVASQHAHSIALTRTKNLQETNYANDYNFIPLYGKGNYGCVKFAGNTAADCPYPNMNNCPVSSQCEYLMQRDLARDAKYTTLNYALWLGSRNQWPQPDLIICDEGHELPDLVLDWAGTVITKDQQDKYFLPTFPRITNSGIASKSAFATNTTTSEEKAIKWLSDSMRLMSKQVDHMQQLSINGDQEQKQDARKAEYFLRKLEATLEAISMAPNDWYIRSGPGALSNGEWGFIAKPLTAKHHFQKYFLNDNKLIVMSATMGNPEVFAKELGVKTYSSLAIQSAYKPTQMPVYALDVPRMGHKSGPNDYKKQAEEIAKAIRRCPQKWSGMIHVNSISQAKGLIALLAKIDSSLSDRLWMPRPGMSTNKTVQEWEWRREANPRQGAIIVTWNLHQGYNGTEEKINICAKIPYPYLGDPFEKERQRYNGTYYLQRAANGAEQMMGRTRRGRPEDYDTPDEIQGMNCLADGSWNWVKNYFSNHFKNCITKL